MLVVRVPGAYYIEECVRGGRQAGLAAAVGRASHLLAVSVGLFLGLLERDGLWLVQVRLAFLGRARPPRCEGRDCRRVGERWVSGSGRERGRVGPFGGCVSGGWGSLRAVDGELFGFWVCVGYFWGVVGWVEILLVLGRVVWSVHHVRVLAAYYIGTLLLDAWHLR